MKTEEFFDGLSKQIDLVFRSHRQHEDPRIQHPWLTGSLGDPFSGIWFIAENPSLTMVERATDPEGGPPTPEAQWYESRGDKLFRDLLVKHGFKSGSRESHGGWHCYITNVIKEADYASRWGAKTQTERNRIAEIWYPVLNWEMTNSNPRLVVILGKKVETLLNHLQRSKNLRLPETTLIQHYTYVALRPRGTLGPMHPQRVKEYDQEFAQVKQLFERLSH